MDATQVLQEWQQKLSDAQRELRDFEDKLGELALTVDANDLAAQLSKLRDAVVIAQSAVKSATAKLGDPRIASKRQQIEQTTKQLADYNAEAAKWEKVYNELEPRFNNARNRMIGAAEMSMRYENFVMSYQLELNALLREQATQ
jgi:capsule polysaccharide export protein KpsE/RkpR